jgi:hypothetical protein
MPTDSNNNFNQQDNFTDFDKLTSENVEYELEKLKLIDDDYCSDEERVVS